MFRHIQTWTIALIGRFGNGDVKEDVTFFSFFQLFRNCLSLFNMGKAEEQSRVKISMNGVKVLCSRPRENLKFGHLTLLLCRGQQRRPIPSAGTGAQMTKKKYIKKKKETKDRTQKNTNKD